MICEKCGKKIKGKKMKCDKCGAKINLEEVGAMSDFIIKRPPDEPASVPEKKSRPSRIFIPVATFLCGAIIGFALNSVLPYINLSKSEEKIVAKSDEKEIVMPESNGQWDKIICYGDDYFLVQKTTDGSGKAVVTIGVVDQKNEWVCELSDENIFVEPIVGGESSEKLTDDCFKYMGRGVFVASPGVTLKTAQNEELIGKDSQVNKCYLFNAETNVANSFDARYISPFDDDGYLLMYPDISFGKSYYSVSVDGTVTKLPVKHTFDGVAPAAYSEGVFFADGHFYDIKGNPVIDLKKYNIDYSLLGTTPYFDSGGCKLIYRDENDELFEGVINTKGEFIKEPTKIKSKSNSKK